MYVGVFDATIDRWNLTSGTLYSSYNGHSDYVKSLVLHEKMLYSGSRDNSVRIWDVASRETIEVFESKYHFKFPYL